MNYKGFTITRTGLDGPKFAQAWEIKNADGVVVAQNMQTAAWCKVWIDTTGGKA